MPNKSINHIEPTYLDIIEANNRISDASTFTPLLENNILNETTGGRVFLKAENLQRTGSFKFRGAYNFLSQLNTEERARGVVAYSSGNHAQGVAAAANLLSIKSTIVMPSDSPKVKLNNTILLGADVITYNRYTEDREDLANQLVKKSGATLVPPYDHPWTISGQGTVGLEIVSQAESIGIIADAILVCCGGGGLTAGISTVFAEVSPSTQICIVEPDDFNDTGLSIQSGKRISNSADKISICDSLLVSTPGHLTFEINKKYVKNCLSVSDLEVRRAIYFAWHHLKVVLEPGGAVALAAVLNKKIKCDGLNIVVLLSGGNIDLELFTEILKNNYLSQAK